jgi:hypothetical protein
VRPTLAVTINQLLSSLVLVSLDNECFPIGPNVHTHSLRLFRRPATGVSGQESLSDSDDESRFSPVLGARDLGDSSDVDSVGELDCSEGDEGIGDGDAAGDVELDDAEIDRDQDEGESKDGLDSDDVELFAVKVNDDDSDDSDNSDDSTEATEDVEASISECAKVYLTVLISSSRGVRNDTFFVAGNIGREAVILRGCSDCTGLLVSIEGRLCESL